MTDSGPGQWKWDGVHHLEWSWPICPSCYGPIAEAGNSVRLLLGPDLAQRAVFLICPACTQLLRAYGPRMRVYRAAVKNIISMSADIGLPCTPDGKQTRVPLSSWADDTHLLIMAWPPESKISARRNPELLMMLHGLPPADRWHEQPLERAF
jgi:hypothetical protein